jgi:hypothetical protein
MTLDYLADNEDLERYNDVFLTREDIQPICSPDTLAALFTKLHYATDTRLEQTPTTLDITSERLRAVIKYIERIAYHHDFEGLAIYLFELRSLTVAIRTELVQNFRKFNEKVLLVLTTEGYERLDFVLLEPYIPTVTFSGSSLQTPSMFGNKQANFSIRPHVLQVTRRNPDEVALRVLRRFTYTENDDVAQYDKLLNAYVIATWSEIYFNNRGLFSDYYLNQRLPELQEWKDTLEVAALRRAHKGFRQLYEDAREAYSGKPEGILRKQLLEPIFAILGFNAQRVPAANKRKFIDASLDDTLPVPDYHLFIHEQATTEKSRALCLTYCWGRNLDGKDDSRDPARPENPGAVAVTLLDAGEADWVIVTNGIVWRLYAAKAHSRATNYYEINLLETLELDPVQREKAFRYYWLLFRERAFAPIERSVAGEARTLSLLDFLLIESEQHARALGERLKNRIFEHIFPYFAQGFVNNARQRGLLPAHLELLPDEERNRLLEPYFTGTLTFLYRLLFLLYAESRDLLPVRQEHGYYEHSLERLKQQIKKDAGDIQDRVERNLESYSETKTDLYQRLWFLFEAIDKGKPELNMPAYNGGLFITEPPAQKEDEPAEITVARFLKEHMIPDRQLALGLDRMARDIDEEHEKKSQAAGEANEHSHALVFIDYKSLGVRHLGSIYEGLLEFKLRLAPTEMAVVEGKRTEEVLPYEEAKRTNRKILKIRQDGELKERVIGRGSTYLENDRRERKATGSYYTPDYIVEYIVEQTVGPLLKKKLDALRLVFRDAQQYLEQRRNLLKSLPHSEVSPENETYKRFRFSLIEAFFDMKVLDPAMGSGHFLVQVVDFITDQMAHWLNSFKWNPIVYELALTRQKIDEEMKQQKVTIDLAKLTDLNLLKRRVLKSCIYGVDLNPMAVELAKIGLWLDCFTVGAPLSFLDHHIKPGNSLLGASVQKVHKNIKDNLFGYQFQYLLEAAQMMRRVSERSDSTVKELVESQNAYQHAYEALRPYKRLFNVWLSHYFGNQGAQEITGQYAEAIVHDDYSNVENASDIPLIQRVGEIPTISKQAKRAI